MAQPAKPQLPPPKMKQLRPPKVTQLPETAQPAPEPERKTYIQVPRTRVFDQTGDLTIALPQPVMASSAQPVLRERLAQFKQQHGEPIAVLLVPELQASFETMEDYAQRVAEKWGVGESERGNGLLVIVAFGNRTQTALSFAPSLLARIDAPTRQRLLQAFLDDLRAAQLAQGLTKLINSVDEHLVANPAKP